MKPTPQHKGRQSIRLQGYDYANAGQYFITICTNDKECLFGHIENNKMVLNEAGKIADLCWCAIPEHYPNVLLHNHIIMPNHVHGILQLTDKEMIWDVQNVGVQNFEPLRFEPAAKIDGAGIQHKNQFQKIIPRSVGSIVRGYKIGVTKWFRDNTDIYKPWQRNFHDHIIRNQVEYDKISWYIHYNPEKWKEDKFFK
jgi:putative transposase